MSLLRRRFDKARESGHGALLAVRGRRRVGKSRLAEEFAGSSEAAYVFFTATQQQGTDELDRFIEAVERSSAPAAEQMRAGLRPETWEAAFELAAEGVTAEQPLILVIDEFPYLVAREPGIEAVLQKVWDRRMQDRPMLVLLIGSDEAMMRALNERGRPLYDRLREMVVRPLSPAAIGDLLGLDAAGALDAHLVIGGFPVLAGEWEAGRKLRGYLTEALTDPTSFFVVSAERSLAAEFPAAASRSVLKAIGSGSRAYSAILSRTGLSATTVNETLEGLRRRGAVSRRAPYSSKVAPRTALWEIVDPYIRFWLRFVDGQIDLIERGRGSLLLEDFERSWPRYRGSAIEYPVREAIELLLPDEARFGVARHLGSYWNRVGSVEVDLVGGDTVPIATRIGFVGSIKWRSRRPFSRADAISLAVSRPEVPGAGGETPLVGVSSSGFDDDTPLDVRLTADDLVDAWRAAASRAT